MGAAASQLHTQQGRRHQSMSLRWREQLSSPAFAPRALETALTEPPDAPACILDDD